MGIVVNADLCNGCGDCIGVCPTDVLEMVDAKASAVNGDECIDCMSCVDTCGQGAIKEQD